MNKYLLILALLCTNCFAEINIGNPECVKEQASDIVCSYYRYSIPMGWLVYASGSFPKSFFVPDADHRWK